MPSIRIRNVPAEVIAALQRRAFRNERSLEGEILYLLGQIAREEPPPVPLSPLQLKLSQASPLTTWHRGEIYGDDGR
jgi:plasmid stability protein